MRTASLLSNLPTIENHRERSSKMIFQLRDVLMMKYALISLVFLSACTTGTAPFGDFLLNAGPSACSSYPNYNDFKACQDKNAAFGKQLNERFSQKVPASPAK